MTHLTLFGKPIVAITAIPFCSLKKGDTIYIGKFDKITNKLVMGTNYPLEGHTIVDINQFMSSLAIYYNISGYKIVWYIPIAEIHNCTHISNTNIDVECIVTTVKDTFLSWLKEHQK